MKFLWTTLYVKDMEKSIAFYTNLLKLKALNRFPAGPGVEITFMGNGDDQETLVELIKDINNTEVNYGEFISIGFAVDSIDSMLETIKSYAIPVHSGPFETSGSKFFMIKDPDGLSVQFFEKKQ